MSGTIINVIAILVGGSIGLIFRKEIPLNLARTMQQGLSLLVLIIGVQYALKSENLAVIGISLIAGAAIGEWRRWEERLQILGSKLEQRFGRDDNQFVRGFVSATLLFCIGAMAVVGALENALTGNYSILLVKSLLDGIFSLLFAASMGIGVLFSAVPVLLYQGAISLGAGWLKPILTDPILNNITAVGGLIIMGLGFNLLDLTKIRVANLLPALLVIPLIMGLFSLFTT